MPRYARFTRGLTAIFAIMVFSVGLFGGALSAHAVAPVVTNAKFSNPVAYELKSLLTTRFSCNVDQSGTIGRLDVLGASGVVKTIYNGPLAAGANVLPAWNGLDSNGKKLTSASFDWRLTVTKNGESTVVRGKITVSRINFCVKGTLAPGAKIDAVRYMIPGPANCYIWAKTTSGTDASLWFRINLSYQLTRLGRTMTMPYPGALLTIPNKTTGTHYLRSPWIVTTRANKTLSLQNASTNPGYASPSADVFMTVIQ